jgi:hypothetical protein
MAKKKRKQLPIPEFVLPETYKKLSPIEIVKVIDDFFLKFVSYVKRSGGPKYANMLDLFIAYGQASRTLNVSVRKRMKEAQRDKNLALLKLKLAYGYWWNRTQYLESFRKSGIGQLLTRKNLDEGKKNIKEFILDDKLTDELLRERYSEFAQLIDTLSTKSELTDKDIKDVLSGKEVTKNYN